MAQSQVRSGYSGRSHYDILKLFTKIRPFLTSIKDILYFPFREGKLIVLTKTNQTQIVVLEKEAWFSSVSALWRTSSWATSRRVLAAHLLLTVWLEGNTFPSSAVVPFPPDGNRRPLFCVAGPPMPWHCEPGPKDSFLQNAGQDVARPQNETRSWTEDPYGVRAESAREVGFFYPSQRAEGLFWPSDLGEQNLSPHFYGKLGSCNIPRRYHNETRT